MIRSIFFELLFFLHPDEACIQTRETLVNKNYLLFIDSVRQRL